MLVIDTKVDEFVVVGGPCVIKVARTSRQGAVLAIEAVETTRIFRGKIVKAMTQAQQRELLPGIDVGRFFDSADAGDS